MADVRCLLAWVLLWGFSLNATVVVIDDVTTMAKKSDVIARGIVVDKKTRQDATGRTITLTTLRVLEALKGSIDGQLLTIYQVGGDAGQLSTHVVGAHHYHFGEELFLFGASLDDMVVSYSVGVGKFRVERDQFGERVREDLSDLVAAKAKTSNAINYYEPKPRVFKTIDAFRHTIKDSLNIRPERDPKMLEPALKALGDTLAPRVKPSSQSVGGQQ
jgi:hypothetical protein